MRPSRARLSRGFQLMLSFCKQRKALLFAAVLLINSSLIHVSRPQPTITALVGNGLSSPTYVNLYWDALWDADNPTMRKAALDAFTAGMLNSSYFGRLTEYGVGTPTFGGGFLPSPLCPLTAPASVGFYDPINPSIVGFLNCELKYGGVPQGSQVIYNIILPATSLENDIFAFCTSGPLAWHFHETPYTPEGTAALLTAAAGLQGTLLAVSTSGNPTALATLLGVLAVAAAAGGGLPLGPLYTIESANPSCGSFTNNLLHEMVEAASDPFVVPGVILKLGCGEIADICTPGCPGSMPAKPTPSFVPPASPPSVVPLVGLFTSAISVPQYWSNAAQMCVTGFTNTVTPVPGALTVDPKTLAITITGQGFGPLPATALAPLPGTPPTVAPLMPYIAVQNDTAGTQSGSLNSVVPGSPGAQLPVTMWTDTNISINPTGSPFTFMPATQSISFWVCNPLSGNCGSGTMRPMVESVNPSTVIFGDSTPVTITGENFYNVRSVSLSDVGFNLPNPTVKSLQLINVTIPATAPLGVHVVTVEAAEGPSTSGFNGPNSNLLSIAPSVTKVDPGNGPITGGTPVTVTGTGFNPTGGTTHFFFGTAGATLTSCASSTTCVTYSPQVPPGTGTVNVQASVQPNPGSASALSPINPFDKFSYGSNPVPIEFLLPNAFFGVQIASVFLNGVAPGPNAGIALTSSDPNPQCQPPLPSVVCMQPSVLIDKGNNSKGFPLEFRPISSKEDVTLTASYGGGSASAIAHLVPWPPLTIMAGWANEFPTRGVPTIAVTIFLNAFAPTGGAAVSLSSNPSIFPNRTVTINGTYWATVTIPVVALNTTTSVTITAAYNGASTSTSMVFLCTPKRPCPKGYYWNNIDCQCEQGKQQ